MLLPYRRLPSRDFRFLVPFQGPGPGISWITNLLSVSGTLHSHHIAALARMEIRAILDLRAEDRDDPVLLAEHGIQFLHLPVRDHFPPSQEQLVVGTRWVLNELRAGRKTLVHCREGIGRSIVLVCCVLMMQGHELGRALRLVESRRWGVDLNAHQMGALTEFAQRVMGTAAALPRFTSAPVHHNL